MTIKELEIKAGVTDRTAFWVPFSKINGTVERNGHIHSLGFEAGVAELRRLASQQAAA